MANRFLHYICLCIISLTMLAIVGCGGGGGSSAASTTTVDVAPVPERISISGAGDLGIFDPSITRDPATGLLWMSYSSVDTSAYYVSTVYWAVSIRMAYSDDNGANWTDAGVVVGPKVEAIVGPMTEAHPTGSIPAGSKGIWQSEMSSIIYDPSAPVAERWKLIWLQYLNANLTSFFVDHSWVAVKAASTPLGLSTAPAVKLFGGIGLKADGSNTGSPVFSPTGGTPAIQLNTDLTRSVGGANLAELNLCIFAEPGLHATSSALYMAIYCGDASTVIATGSITEYVVYFRCNSPCSMTNAASWEYLGRLLTPADAQNATGDHHFQAPAMVEKNGTTYLVVTPVDSSGTGERYNGCRVYEFSDINSNQLRRDSGILTEVARVDGDVGIHNGACAAYNGLAGGIMLSQSGTKGTADAFKIYKSQQKLP